MRKDNHSYIYNVNSNKLNVTVIGCGWLGLTLAKTLLSAGHKVQGSTTQASKLSILKDAGFNGFQLDLTINSQISTEISKITDVLVITIPPIDKQQPKLYGEKLVELCRQFEDTTQVIFTSSTGIYPQKDGEFTEDYIFSSEEQKTSLYHAEKELSSLLGSRLTVLRLGGLIGDKRHPVYSLQGKTGIQNPDGPINLVHQLDVIALLTQLIQQKTQGEIYNVVNPKKTSRKEYYNSVCDLLGLKRVSFQDGASLQRTISSKKVCAELGFTFKHDIEHILEY